MPYLNKSFYTINCSGLASTMENGSHSSIKAAQRKSFLKDQAKLFGTGEDLGSAEEAFLLPTNQPWIQILAPARFFLLLTA